MMKRTTFALAVAALGCVVALITAFVLSVPALSAEAETYCGKAEHEHSESCYEKVLTCDLEETEGHTHTDACYKTETVTTLICGKEEGEGAQEEVIDEETGEVVQEAVPGHVHTDACYQTEEVKTLICGQEEVPAHKHTSDCYTKELTCGKEEHKHTDECHSNKDIDVESAIDWEATLPGNLTGVWADDLVKVAESQLGYTESKANFVPGNGRRMGYSRYGAWYGNAYGDWCAMFVSWCLNYANIPDEAFMREASCPNWVAKLKAKDMYYPAHGERAYTPVKGDVLFFDWEGDGTVDHVGIVVEVKDDQIKTIEGNSGDTVQYCMYPADSGDIVGYGKLPQNPDDPAVKAKKAEEEAKAQAEKLQEGVDKVQVAADASVQALSRMQLVNAEFAHDGADVQKRYENAQAGFGGTRAGAGTVSDEAATAGPTASAMPPAPMVTAVELEGEAQVVGSSSAWRAVAFAAASAE
jgi:hypothetical protein